jgi:hypothetical protein
MVRMIKEQMCNNSNKGYSLLKNSVFEIVLTVLHNTEAASNL